MSSFERRGALDFLLENRRSRNQDFKHPRRLLSLPGRPIRTSTWRPDCSDSGHYRRHRRPMYVSFVTKAILWDRGGSHHTVHDHLVPHPPSVCPRFLSHMKAHPEDFHSSCYLNNKYQQQLPSQGKMQSFNLPPATETQFLEGHPNTGGGLSGAQSVDLIKKRHYAAVLPRLQIPATPPLSPSSFDPNPLQHNTPHLDPKGQESNLRIIPATKIHPPPGPPVSPHVSPQPEEKVVSERETVFQPVSKEPDWDLNLRSSGSSHSASPTSLSMGTHSRLSRPSSSLFSRSTDLFSGRSSILSDLTAADTLDSYPERSVGASPSELSPMMQSPVTSFTPTELTLQQPLKNSTCKSASSLPEKLSDEFRRACSPVSAPGAKSTSDKPQSTKRMTKTAGSINLDTSTECVTNLSLSADEELNKRVFPCRSPLGTIPGLQSGAKLTPCPPPSRLDSHRWPVLPPISPNRGFSAASGCSEISCSQSQMFDELEVIAPLSASSLSLDRPSDSSDSPRSSLTEPANP
ncbi:hypothetical protein AMECASPLE_012522 [Ameca splendens]|uniref:Uncharacterized protein n=1 Tax=Ameca splendens TaxID=208324 RepID=A0ABV0ZXL7_9TELE